ncbi:spectrin beta chain, non-erythrocytic 2-like isoform X2 [Empidonax traillii]|uniref:spectrin beta chain, non-erythrocytic 2-like isoform X2 n=1 Tax=Empidonax traillii TaxID=164674 RepID=UPI000FFD7AB7|nr:spectrin beta chain, non-erythrocytic 2-like isoform X2 [Empidonax traillii]
MSGSTARKVQPFTISTRLSLPKCAADFPGAACPGIALASALDSHRGLRRSINERISLYLAHARAGPAAPAEQPRSPSPGEDGGTDEDRMNRNSLARSIKKITLSNWYGEAGAGNAGRPGDPARVGSERNHNNNNSRTGKAQFKVFLRKDVDAENEQQEPGNLQANVFCSPVDRCSPYYALAGSPVSSPQKESLKGKESAAAPRCSGRNAVGAALLLDPSPLVAQFNREMLQAEGWVRGKLRDLKDGCDLQDWEEVAQTLQRDMKDFENTLIKLNQMGEQLMWQASPSAEAVRRQLLALQSQWQLLKQTAASQSKALGGLRSLQDFNRKAERLEAWIKNKEEKPSLEALLQESPDKIQLTRRILDLKQEEQQFQSLHKELNSLAQKLEKQGKSESRNISARRKHLNKTWLRLQGTLKEHHEALQLALEVSAFFQQADILLGAIHAKQSSICGAGKSVEGVPCQDRDVRDIASQVMMLDVTMSQLLNLQPRLAAQVTSKHRDVKESWAQLQQALRSEKAPALASISTGSKAVAVNTEPRGDNSSHGTVGKEAGAKWTRGLGSMVAKDVLGKMTEPKRGEESSPGCPVGQPPRGGDNKRRRREAESEGGMQQLEAQVQDVCQAVNATLSPYNESVGPGVSPCPAESLKAARIQQKPLDYSSSVRAVLLEGQTPGRPPGSPKVEAMLRELGELWEDLQRKHQENGVVLQEIDKALRLVGELDQAERWLQAVGGSLSEPATMRSPAELRQDLEEMGQLEKQLLMCGLKLQALREEAAGESPTEHEGARKMQRKVEMVEEKLAHVQAALRRRAADLRDSLVLSEFLQDLQEEEAQNQQGSAAPGSRCRGLQGSFPLLSAQAEQPPSSEDMSSPLGELQEAVEMLNDAAKERERVMEVAAEMESLEHLVSEVSPQLEALRCRAKVLAQDIVQAESGFTTVKSEKDLQGLQGLLSRQQEMEHAVSETLQGQLEELERAAARLQELCPAQQCPTSREVQETLRAWAGLRELLRETRARVQQASRLRHFFKDYLAMISWTEDTRAQIFSESPSSPSLPKTPCEELERRIEEKLKEFEALAASGQQLVSEEHYLSATIKERLEELQSMLGWVLVRWRAQRHQKELESKQEDRRDPKSPSLTSQEQHTSCALSHLESIHSPVEFMPCSLLEPVQSSEPRQPGRSAVSTLASPLSDAPSGAEQSWGTPSSKTPHGAEPRKEPVTWDPAETSTLLLPPRGPTGLGGTVNLILSVGKKGEKKKAQLLADGERPGEEALQTLPTTKPSGCKTFWKRCQGLLGNTWGSLKRKRKPPHQPVEEVQVEARKTSTAKRPPAVIRRPPASGSGTPPVSHTMPKVGAGSLFNSLQRREQARAEQAQLLTLQGIMGESSLRPTPEERHGPSNTWPQKCGRRKGGLGPAAAAGPRLGQLLLYVKNPLVQDIDAECGAAPRDPCLSDPKTACPHLSLGSVLSLELPRDAVVLGRHRGATAWQQEAEGQEQRQSGVLRPWEAPGTHGVGWQEEVDMDGHSPQGPGKSLETSPKSERGTWFEEVSFNPSYSQHRAYRAGEEHRSPQHSSSTGKDLLDLRLSQPSHVGMQHERVCREGDELATQLGQDSSPSATGRARHRKATHLELGSSPVRTPGRAGAIPGPACTPWPASSSQPRRSSASPTAPTQLSVVEWALASPQPHSPVLGIEEVCHPAHRLFEEEEEELQAIWDGADERRAQSPPGGSCASHQTGSRAGSLPSPSAAVGGPLILSSANNLLVAKFTLPTTARLLHSPSGEKSPRVVHSGSGSPSGLRVSPNLEELGPAVTLDGSSAWDQRRHKQEERESSNVPPGKMEFQMMEGTLERKHVLQTGGRKASCRAWGLFHAVLMRQTLCFYQDRRDSLKSSVVALPLNLSGAICTPDAEYTKKTNCFRLQLQDGSEYLLRAPSQPLMNEWVSKLQQNSGFPEVDYFQAAAQRVEGTGGTGGFSKVPSPGSSHLQGHNQVMTTRSQEIVVLPCSTTRLQRSLDSQDGPAKGTVAATENAQGTGHKEQQWSPRGSPGLWDNICQEDDYGLVANKRRSYSFTSATYQKITPVVMHKEPVEAGSSYSVTLYIGEQVPAMPRARCHSFVAQTGSPRDTLGEKTTSPLRPKNKSVFKKFFGKKE